VTPRGRKWAELWGGDVRVSYQELFIEKILPYILQHVFIDINVFMKRKHK